MGNIFFYFPKKTAATLADYASSPSLPEVTSAGPVVTNAPQRGWVVVVILAGSFLLLLIEVVALYVWLRRSEAGRPKSKSSDKKTSVSSQST